ncbi:Hemin transport protein [Pseudoxanthomonas broegbernensis]|uniref:Hemin transport protein n=2 Tax=Pseudoxanthomonas broegbernensis TaxID=83619 RepID=A0A7V8K6X5_9GAMM|nr:Hemin transport protein [Pseudoxanthomonas broegbernensis]KAF1686186.1 Hemin transport protein [Pseudoxanthomonas broegbernensis]
MAQIVANAAAHRGAALPQPRQLAELGTVLCMYRPQRGSELAGWTQAVRAECRTGMDSDGPYESLRFFDCHGRCCWRLFLLPDSDFLAWDILVAQLPARAEEEGAQGGVTERLWRRLAGRLGGGDWRLCALRLHALPQSGWTAALAASPAPVSAVGVAIARRIARQEGAVGEVRLDDCCCAGAAVATGLSPTGGSEVPLVRL